MSITETQAVPVRHYGELLTVLRARMTELNISNATLDATAGLQDGYSGKLLCDPPIKRGSWYMIFLVLQALGLQATISESPQALEAVKNRLVPRKERRSRRHPRIITIDPDAQRIYGRMGALAFMQRTSPEQRSRNARRAVRARWSAARARARAAALSNDPQPRRSD